MSTDEAHPSGRRRRPVVIGLVMILLLVVVWQVNGALVRAQVRVYPLSLECGGKRMPVEAPASADDDEALSSLEGPALHARLTSTAGCRAAVKVTNPSRFPVVVRSADFPRLGHTSSVGDYWEVVRDTEGRTPEVIEQDARFELSETVDPGESWSYSFVLQHRAGTRFCRDLVTTQQLPLLHLSVLGARGSHSSDVWLRTTADRSLGRGPSTC